MVIIMRLLVGILIILSSVLNSLLSSNFKKSNYIFGLICYILMGLVAYINHIYGMFFFYIFIFAPLQIYGYYHWGKNSTNERVKVRTFSFKNRIIAIISCIIISIAFAFVLVRIPGARFTFLDAFSNIINLCGVILLALRFNESWWLWLINNIIDVVLWTMVYNISGDYAIPMLISCVFYLVINIYGIYKWNKKSFVFDVVKVEKKKQIITIAYCANFVSSVCYFIIFNWIAFLVSICDIVISLIDSSKLNYRYKYLITVSGTIVALIIAFLPFEKTMFEFLPLLDLLLYSFIPIMKKNSQIQFIGLINIIIFTIYDIYIGLFNLVLLDIGILFLFLYRMFIVKIVGKKLVIKMV